MKSIRKDEFLKEGETMDQLSALLRQARQEKQLSLKDISEVTKIQTRYLDALETAILPFLPEGIPQGGATEF